MTIVGSFQEKRRLKKLEVFGEKTVFHSYRRFSMIDKIPGQIMRSTRSLAAFFRADSQNFFV